MTNSVFEIPQIRFQRGDFFFKGQISERKKNWSDFRLRGHMHTLYQTHDLNDTHTQPKRVTEIEIRTARFTVLAMLQQSFRAHG